MKELVEKVSILFREKEHRLGELVVDAFVSETHHLSAKVTEHPVESGGCIVDHIYNEPVRLEIKGIISNTPMTLVGLTVFRTARNYFNDQSNDLAGEAFKKLEKIFAKREPITIATSLKDYHKMVLESLSIERDGHSSASLHFSCTAKQIRVVDQRRINIPESKNDRAKPKKKLGKQETKQASPEIKKAIQEKVGNKSAAAGLFDWARSALQ